MPWACLSSDAPCHAVSAPAQGFSSHFSPLHNSTSPFGWAEACQICLRSCLVHLPPPHSDTFLKRCPVNIAFWLLLRPYNAPKPSQWTVAISISLLTLVSVVLRAEVFLYLFPLVLQLLLQRYISLSKVIVVGIVTGFASIGNHQIFFCFTKSSHRRTHSLDHSRRFLLLGRSSLVARTRWNLVQRGSR